MNTKVNRREFLVRMAAVSAMHSGLVHGGTALAQDSVRPAMKLRRLQLKAANLAAQAAFYREVLRLPVEADGERVVVTAGHSEIEFTQAAEGEKPFYHFAFTIPENRLEGAMEWLEPRCRIENIKKSRRKTIQFRNWDAEACYFFDPAGNILEFIAHHPLGNGVGAPFSEEHILHVSEIGLVVPSVPDTEALVGKTLGLGPYRGSSENFAPLGDINGVLIVVPQERIWLPTTDVPASVFETDVQAEGLNGDLVWDALPYRVRRFG